MFLNLLLVTTSSTTMGMELWAQNLLAFLTAIWDPQMKTLMDSV